MTKEDIISSVFIIISLIIGLLISVLLSSIFCPKILDIALKDDDEKSPKGISESAWKSITHQSKSGERILGILETIFFFISFWISHPELIAVWLIFKIGSKWEIWNNIIKVPEKLEKVDEEEYLDARHKWGIKELMRFLIGTMSTILFAIGGIAISYGILRLGLLLM